MIATVKKSGGIRELLQSKQLEITPRPPLWVPHLDLLSPDACCLSDVATGMPYNVKALQADRPVITDISKRFKSKVLFCVIDTGLDRSNPEFDPRTHPCPAPPPAYPPWIFLTYSTPCRASVQRLTMRVIRPAVDAKTAAITTGIAFTA
jgi:hypothetical protein